jgi:hypothetical protein
MAATSDVAAWTCEVLSAAVRSSGRDDELVRAAQRAPPGRPGTETSGFHIVVCLTAFLGDRLLNAGQITAD